MGWLFTSGAVLPVPIISSLKYISIQNISLDVLAVSAGLKDSVSGKTEPGFAMKHLERE